MDYIVVHQFDTTILTFVVEAEGSNEAHEKYVDYISNIMGWDEEMVEFEFGMGNIRIRPINNLVRI
jgi:hypothetical protein